MRHLRDGRRPCGRGWRSGCCLPGSGLPRHHPPPPLPPGAGVPAGVWQVPLAAESVDVAVFCLALMGTNLQEILEEANRVLKQGPGAGWGCRLPRGGPGAEAVLPQDLSSAFFHLLEFAKTGRPRRQRPAPGLRLRPCLYKRR
uniref:Ribosomal RNA-processing protein 8 n=1 Tax=Accipiter nisus TaxID=211598 RepID=A0A8B9N8X8_9AVES